MEQQEQGQTKQHWPPGSDVESDKAIVAEMLENSDSPHWGMCLERVGYLVRASKSIPTNLKDDLKDDITQNVMIKFKSALQTYRGEARLKYWIATVVQNRVIDEMRSYIRREDNETSLDELREGTLWSSNQGTVEEEAVRNENRSEMLRDIREFARRESIRRPDLYPHYEEFVDKVFREGVSPGQTAKEHPLKNPYYMLRKVRNYLQRKKRPPPE